MSGEKNIEAQLITRSPVSSTPPVLSEKDMEKDRTPADSSSALSADPVSRVKAVDKPSSQGQDVYYPPTSCYDYYYPGFNGSCVQSDDSGYYNAAGGSYTGIQADNSSLLYYVPGYGSYPTGFLSVDGKSTYPSTEVFQCYTYDSTYSGSCSTAKSASRKANGYKTAKTNTKTSAFPSNSKVQQSSNFLYQNQSLKAQNKLGTGLQYTNPIKGFHPAAKFQSFTSPNPGVYMQYGSVNYQSNGKVWNNNYRNKSRDSFRRNAENEYLNELTRGPRSSSPKLAAEAEKSALDVEKDKYNSQDFQIEYENAKFYVIKSYSEDDIHKCIKYDVWSSTPNGNRKLDAGFHEADAKTTETGTKCPVFLFFSVNGSGQFVGVAEMMGQVDFSKNMDFWQLDKWNGFFPIKWHIIKDVPNTQLRHIILENNENRPVTYSRDTQEIGLKQGLEMLSIFKNYSEKTSVLDDFSFYEIRETSHKAKRISAKPAAAAKASGSENGDHKNPSEAGKGTESDPSSLITLTNNLSLNSQSLKSSI